MKLLRWPVLVVRVPVPAGRPPLHRHEVLFWVGLAALLLTWVVGMVAIEERKGRLIDERMRTFGESIGILHERGRFQPK